MFSNYVKIALRQLRRNQLFSLLNITGLTVGLAVSTFIALYVWHEFHYDRFQPFADRTYRILSTTKFGSDEMYMTGMHESFGREIKRLLPEVEEVVRVSQWAGQVTLQSDTQHQFKEVGLGYADASLLPVMGYSLLNGVDPKTALSAPGRIVLTRQLALKYFGTENAVGKTLLYDRQHPLTVSGVLDDYPTNSYFQFQALISLASMPTLGANTRFIFEKPGFLETFLVFRPDANAAITAKKLKKVSRNVSFKDDKSTYTLEPLPSLHLIGRGRNNPKQVLYVFLSIALAILVLAIINYVSLTTARAAQRAREVGIRKAAGGLRRELIGQFFTESFLTTMLAFGLSVILLFLLFPWTKSVLKLPISADVLNQSAYWGVMLGLYLACALLAGSYPALLLSGFRPQDVLKGSGSPGTLRGATGVRRLFTTIQFTVLIGLLICSLVIYVQMRYLQFKQIGIDRAQVVALSIDRSIAPRFAALRNDVRQWLGPDRVATTNTALFTYQMMTYLIQTKTTKKDVMVNAMTVDAGFFRTMGVRWIQAPDGWPNRAVTRELVVYNQALVKEAGLKMNGSPSRQSEVFEGEMVDGVVSNFHNHSLHQTVDPMRLSVVSDTSRAVVSDGGYLLVRFDPRTDVPTAMGHLRDLYNQHQPTTPFDYYFLDDAYNELYDKGQRQARLFNGFTALTLFVACLGLLGLMTFTVEARTKEIGIRKVLGASVASLVTLLSKDFLKLVLLAIVIASPIAWYVMNRWLQDFAYKIDIEWWMFAGAGVLTTSVALLTISFQAIKAALTNPVNSLRSE